MSDIARENLERLNDCASSISIKLSFWFDDDYFENDEEVQEIVNYCESGEMDEFTDAVVDEFLVLIHQHFFDPPYQSPMGSINRPMGITLDSHISYDL
jgi:hypothetical protein